MSRQIPHLGDIEGVDVAEYLAADHPLRGGKHLAAHLHTCGEVNVVKLAVILIVTPT